MHSWLSVKFARTARVHDDSRQFAANRIKNLHRIGSVLGVIRTGAARFGKDRRAYRSVRGSLSGILSAGAIHPALPQEAPAATPTRSTTVTETPRSCRNHAVDNPTMPAPTTIADRGPIRLSSTITNLLQRRRRCRWWIRLRPPPARPPNPRDRAARVASQPWFRAPASTPPRRPAE